MSSPTEACPFCGKAFKRLKTHLPHCKMAPVTKATQSTKTPVAITSKKSDGTLSSSSSLLLSTTAKKSNKTSSPSLSSLLSSSSPSQSSSSSLTPPITKKKKKRQQPPPDETQIVASSSSLSVSSSPSLPPSIARPKKKSPKVEGDQSQPVPGRPKGTKATSLGLLSPALSLGTDPNSPRAAVLTRGQSSPTTASSEPNTTPTPTGSANTKPKAAPRKKGPQREKAELSTPKVNTVSQDPLPGVLREEGLHAIGRETGARPNGRIQFWEEVEVETEGSRIEGQRRGAREEVQRSGSGQTKPVLQDHTSTTDRNGPERLCDNTSVPDRVHTSATDQNPDGLHSQTRSRGPIIAVDLSQTSTPAFGHNGQTGSLLASAANLLAQPPYTTSPQTDRLTSLTRKWGHDRSLKPSLPPSLAASLPRLANPKPPSGLPYLSQGGGSPQVNPPPPLSPSVSPPPPHHLAGPPHPSSAAHVTPLRSVVGSEELTGRQLTGHFTTSPYTPVEHGRSEALPRASPYPPPAVPPPTLPLGAGPGEAGQSVTQHSARTHSAADNGIVVAERTLGRVRLKELPDWLAQRIPGRPREGAEMLHRGWQWYYKRYIDVKRGGVGGVAMLLAGYCVLSYMWSYPHLKRERWRKYH